MSFETDNAAVRELILCTENDGRIYQQLTQPIIKNLATKKVQGKYDSGKAVQGFMHLAETGARAYAKNFDNERNWHVLFPIAVRRSAATHWRDEFEKEYALGNYDDMVPKKYQKTPTTQAEYDDGSDHAQLVAKYAPKSAIEYMLATNEVFPQPRRHIPEIAHLPLPKNHRKPAFRQGFLHRLRNILDAMEGN